MSSIKLVYNMNSSYHTFDSFKTSSTRFTCVTYIRTEPEKYESNLKNRETETEREEDNLNFTVIQLDLIVTSLPLLIHKSRSYPLACQHVTANEVRQPNLLDMLMA